MTHARLLLLFALLALALGCPRSPQAQPACTHYAAPEVRRLGNGTSPDDAFLIDSFWDTSGTVLCLADGEYTGASSMIVPTRSGTAGIPIIIRAINDGQVFLNGQYARKAFDSAVAWITVEGVNMCCGGPAQNVIELYDTSANTTLRRIVAWDAGGPSCTGNNHVATLAGVKTLFEDVAFWGCGRKMIGRQGDKDSTVRRAFAMKNREPEEGGGAISTFYHSTGSLTTENCIMTEHMLSGADYYDQRLLFADHNCNPSAPCNPDLGDESHDTYLNAYGNITYHTDAQSMPRLWYLNGPDPNANNTAFNQTVHVQEVDALALRRDGPTEVEKGGGEASKGATVFGLRASQTDIGTRPGMSGTVILTSTRYTDSSGSLATGTHTSNVGNRLLSQFVGGDLLQFTHVGPTPPPFGAWLRYRYVNTVLDSTGPLLWPWPMNLRIINAMGTSGYASQGGLDGNGATDLTALIGTLTGATFVTAPPDPHTLLASWPFNDDTSSTAKDVTNNLHDGTLLGGATLGTGKVGAKGLVFDTTYTGRMEVPGLMTTATLLAPPASVTLETWFKIDSLDPTWGEASLITIGDYVTIKADGSRIRTRAWTGSAFQTMTFTTALIGNGWHFVVAVFDTVAHTQSLYVDGVSCVTNASLPGNLVYSGGPGGSNTYLARWGGDTNKYNFAGAMDQTRIYNYGVTPAEALAHYNEGLATGRVYHRAPVQ